MANPAFGCEDLSFDFLEDDPATYDAVDGFLRIGSAIWTEALQRLLENALRERPRPVHVGNPDSAAPREGGPSHEPRYWAHRLADGTGVVATCHGKPCRDIYDLAFARLDPAAASRMVMVGDSLPTDAVGGQVAGVATAPITSHGLLHHSDAGFAISKSGLRPDHVLLTT